jgi:hypothetical protein
MGRESRVRAANWLNDSPARPRRRRMTAANAPHTGSSEMHERSFIHIGIIF